MGSARVLGSRVRVPLKGLGSLDYRAPLPGFLRVPVVILGLGLRFFKGSREFQCVFEIRTGFFGFGV